MKQQAVHDYVKKKRGLYAYDGGEVPDEEEEDVPEADLDPEPAPAPAPEAPAEEDSGEDVGAASAPIDRNSAIRAHLAQKYAQAADSSGVQAAGAARDRGNMISRVFEGLEGAARADSMAHGGVGVNHAGYQDVRNENNQNVGRAEAARQSNIQGFLRKNEMDRQVAADAMKSDDEKRKVAGAKLTADRADAGSAYSKSLQPAFAQLYGDQLGDIDVTTLSANAMTDFGKQLTAKGKIDEAAAAAADRTAATRDNAKVRADSLALGRETNAQHRAEYADARADKKAAEGQGKAYTEMTQRQAGGKGAPPDIKQAMNDKYSIEKAGDLLKGDLNKISPERARLVAAEMEKVATGGAGSEAGRQGLDPHTFTEHWAEFKNKFVSPGGEVSGAGLGAFLQQNKEYLEGVGKIAEKKVNKYRRDTFDDYATSGRLSNDHIDAYKKKHPQEFPEENEQQPAAAPVAPAQQGGPGMALGAPEQNLPPAPHPQDSQAVAWGRANLQSKNPKTVQKARAILDANGVN